jgi:ATP-dependent helicase STH1/SNF2
LEDKTEEQNDVDEEEEVDNEELNEMLKRGDDELAVFERIDAEREEQEIEQYRRKGGRGPVPERLIQEHELPDVYKNDDVYTDVVQQFELGRGQREKASVIYDDGLTEDQWLNVSHLVFLLPLPYLFNQYFSCRLLKMIMWTM